VQPGDTFESIAACYYGESSRAIVVRRENEGLETPVAGTRIWIAVEDDGTNAERMYTVVEGDNLWNIAHKAYGKGWWYKRIQVANQNMLGESNALRVGMKLRLP
jgi:nucleoid-associated protein YgaU